MPGLTYPQLVVSNRGKNKMEPNTSEERPKVTEESVKMTEE
jgi:hypothetical protein